MSILQAVLTWQYWQARRLSIARTPARQCIHMLKSCGFPVTQLRPITVTVNSKTRTSLHTLAYYTSKQRMHGSA